MSIIVGWLGKLLLLLYSLVNNYGVAIILFTVIVKLILSPLTVKQQKSLVATQRIQPKIQEIQNKYKNDKDKQSQELMKIYQENNINPMSGCLPLLIQLPIIWALYRVITQPLTSMFGMAQELIDKIGNAVGVQTAGYTAQIELAQHITPEIAQQFELGTYNYVNLNFDFLGLNLGVTPSVLIKQFGEIGILGILPYLIIPALSILTTWLSSKISTSLTQKNNTSAQAQSMNQSMGTMNLLMPLIMGYFTYTVPSGVGLYWVASNLIQIITQVVVTKYIQNKYTAKADIIEEAPSKKGNKGGSKQ